jgi:hypothetical protein
MLIGNLSSTGPAIRLSKNISSTRPAVLLAQAIRAYRMDVNLINTYLQRAREIIGERSTSEIEYDNAVVAHLSAGLNIRKAIAAANRQYPEEALKPKAEHWGDLAARYQYMREHKAILHKLGMTG